MDYKTDSFLPQPAKFVLSKIFKVNIKKNVSYEAQKRKLWLINYMLSEGYEVKDWIEDLVPFLNENNKDLETLYQKNIC